MLEVITPGTDTNISQTSTLICAHLYSTDLPDLSQEDSSDNSSSSEVSGSGFGDAKEGLDATGGGPTLIGASKLYFHRTNIQLFHILRDL